MYLEKRWLLRIQKKNQACIVRNAETKVWIARTAYTQTLYVQQKPNSELIATSIYHSLSAISNLRFVWGQVISSPIRMDHSD